MKTNRIIRYSAIIIMLCFIMINTSIANSSSGTEQVLQSCIDDQAFAVVHFDFEKFNVDALGDFVTRIISKIPNPDISQQMQKEADNAQKQLDELKSKFMSLGGKDIYLVFSIYDFPYFFAAIPFYPEDENDNINNQIQLYQYIENIAEEGFNEGIIKCYASDNIIFAGLEQTIERIKTISPVKSDLLTKSLDACGDTTIQISLFPSQDQRRILAEMLPAIYTESGSLSLETPIKELDWISLGINTPPSHSINLTIQNKDAQATGQMMAFVNDVYSFIEQDSIALQYIPEIEKILEQLKPKQKDNQLIIHADNKSTESIISDFIAPYIVKVNTTATRMVCASNLSAIGKALLIYANDYDDTLPPDLDILTKHYEVSEKTLVCPTTKSKDSYVFRGANLNIASPPYMILIYEKTGIHGDGRNVLFNDTHVDWVPEEHFKALIEEDNEYRRKNDLPVIPIQ